MSTTSRGRNVCSQGIIGWSRNYPLVSSLPLTMLLEFLLEFLHGISFVHIIVFDFLCRV